MRTCARINGLVSSEANYDGEVQRVKYECFVAFDSLDDHLDSMTHFFEATGHDMEKHPEIADSRNCARALCFAYFREKGELFDDQGNAHLMSEFDLPKTLPTKQEARYSIWIKPLNAAILH
jgi:hypothetical protein